MTFTFSGLDQYFYIAALPIFILCVGSLIVLLQGISKSLEGPKAVGAVTFVTLIGAIVATQFAPAGETQRYLDGSYVLDGLSSFGQVLILSVATIFALLTRATHLRPHFFKGEICSLYLMLLAGMLIMISTDEMVSLFIGLEMASIGIYALVGYIQPTRRSQEGAIKYLVLGSFAAGFMLFGMALLYASTGTMHLSLIVEKLAVTGMHPWAKLGVLLFICGLAFKLAMVPFHLWAPDAYEAAPTAMTGFMATTVKVMILLVTLRVVGAGLQPMQATWGPILMILAMASIVVGNIMALVQSSLKRMLAYSSIAHSGYMAVALCALSGATTTALPTEAILFYLIGYCIVSIGTFGILMWLESETYTNIQLDDLSGIAKQFPWAAFAMAVFMFSFAGIPPAVGFITKFFVFSAAVQSQLYMLAVIGFLGSAIALFYYLRVIVRMYMTEANRTAFSFTPKASKLVTTVAAIAVIATLAMGTVLPGSMMKFAKTHSRSVKLSSK